MRRRLLALMGIILVGLCGAPAWADYGGPDSITQPFEAKITVDVYPLSADVWLDGAYLGGARELTNLEVPLLRGRHLVTVAAPGFKPRFIIVDATTHKATRLAVDLIPDRKR